MSTKCNKNLRGKNVCAYPILSLMNMTSKCHHVMIFNPSLPQCETTDNLEAANTNTKHKYNKHMLNDKCACILFLRLKPETIWKLQIFSSFNLPLRRPFSCFP